MLNPRLTLNCRGTLLSLQSPQVMGILNVTPDSFFDGGRYTRQDALLRQAEQMLKEGAAILDIGGMSSRPGAELISVEEELQRVVPAIEALHQAFPEAILSIDTIRGRVAEEAVGAGAAIVNDISAGAFDESMYPTVARLQVPYILMHMKGSPKTMQDNPDYEDVVQTVLDFFIAEVGKLRALDVHDIVLDPGFGFGKTVEHNYQLLKQMHLFKILDLPLLAGLSRKSMINKVLKTKPEHALNGTTALNMVALQQGAKILRVHDVRPAMEAIKLWQQLEMV
ncbi:dihydropteroate synthase [Phaeodactylibacter xiamenensis]|uniref:Dihydropteroate synthase n=2 Tax=Phaeodactylibacter xiamenensis TaxID=1524460 RepID=A0A098S175_9BACT|nr:dihydropteroate synthase [Phaeodactylibacter xiamenensis]